MKVTVLPSRPAGRVSAPPSKSMAHRALLAAALFGEKSVIEGIALSKDITSTLECLERMGASVSLENTVASVGALDPFAIPDGTVLNCRESGSTLRFLIPVCMLGRGRVRLEGAERLFERPLGVYEELAKKLGIFFERDLHGVTVGSGLVAGEYEVDGGVSSQFITGLLFALSCLDSQSTLTVTGAFESESYVDLTLAALGDFSRRVERKGRVFTVYPSPRLPYTEYRIEGDYSNAAFLASLSLLGGEVEVGGLRDDSLQGDRVWRDLFPRITQGYCRADLSDCPDLAPILFALAAAFHGGEFTGTARLAIKESDRASAMKAELEKLGASLVVERDRVTVEKRALHPPTSPISSHNDHRIAMAMAVLLVGLGGEIEGAEAVEKSYPDFWRVLEGLKVGIRYDA